MTAITADTVLDLPENIGQVQSRVRFNLLDRNLSFITQLYPISDGNAQVVLNTTSTIMRTCSGLHLDVTDTARLDVFAHRVQPIWDVRTEAGYTPFSLGVFVMSDSNIRVRTSGRELKGTLYDQTVMLTPATDFTFSLDDNTKIRDVLILLAASVGISGRLIEADASNAVTTGPIAWPPGTSRYKIMSELAGMAGYYPPFFNNNGVLRLKLVPASLANAVPDHVYEANASSRMHVDTVVETRALASVPNRWIVTSGNNKDEPIVGVYDLPASAPHSFANRGYLVTKTVQKQGIENQTQASLAAYIEAVLDDSMEEAVTFDAAPDPRHDAFAVVRYDSINYRETGWTIKLKAGGPHQHKLQRLY